MHRRNVHLGAAKPLGGVCRMFGARNVGFLCAQDVGALVKTRECGFKGKRRRCTGRRHVFFSPRLRACAERRHGVCGRRATDGKRRS